MLARRERQDDGAQRVPERLRPPRPRVDVVRAAVVEIDLIRVRLADVVLVQRFGARPVHQAPLAAEDARLLPAGPHADLQPLAPDVVAEVHDTPRRAVGLVLARDAERVELERRQGADEPAGDAERQAGYAVGAEAEERLGSIVSVLGARTCADDDVPPLRPENLASEAEVVQVVSELHDPTIPVATAVQVLERPPGVEHCGGRVSQLILVGRT